jgi:nitrate reductase gamma subunit
MDLLAFARGPALWLSILVCVIASAWRIFALYRLGKKPDLSEPRSTDLAAGAVRGILVRMRQRKEFRRNGKLGALNGYLYHLGLAVIVSGYLPHILFVERVTGIRWPALPEWMVYVAAGPAIVGLVVVLLERLTDPVLRLLSGFDDWFSWFVVFLPLMTGRAATGGWSPQLAANAAPVYPVPLAIHLLSVELLLVWLPFGKLAHVFLVFISRGISGAALARKGAAI